MNPTEQISRPPFAVAMKRLANAEPIVPDRGHTLDEKRIADYQRLLDDAGIPLERSDVNRYVQLLERHSSVGLASRPKIYENESIGVAALADLHRAPGSRLIPQNDRETLQNDIEWRSGRSAPRLRFAAPPGPTLLRVARESEPETSVSHAFSARGTIVSVDDSHVVMQAHDATYRFRTADVAAAVDIGRIAIAKERGLPVHIRRADARVTVEVEPLQVQPPQKEQGLAPARPATEKQVWRITDDLPLPPANLFETRQRKLAGQPGAAPTLDQVLAALNRQERAARIAHAAPDRGPKSVAQRSAAIENVPGALGKVPTTVDKAPGRAETVSAPEKVPTTFEKVRARVEKGSLCAQEYPGTFDAPLRQEPVTRANQHVVQKPASSIEARDDRGPSNGAEKANFSNSDRLVLKGRFVKVQRAESGQAVGLVFKDDKDRPVQLSKEHTAALLKNGRANDIIRQNLQSGAAASNVNLSYFKGKWSVSQAPQVYKPR